MTTAQENLQIQKDTQMNMTQLTSRGVSDAWLASLYDMGDKGWSQIRAMNGMTNEQLAAYVKLWEEAGGDANLEYKDGIWQIVEETKEATDAAAVAAKEGGIEVGGNISSGTETGVDAGIPGIKAAARRAAKAAVDAAKAQLEIASPSKKAKNLVGLPFAQGIGVGIEDGLRDIVKKVKLGTENLITGVSPSSENVAIQAKASSQQNMRDLFATKSSASVIQNNTFTSKELSPYEQRVHLQRLDNDLAEVFG